MNCRSIIISASAALLCVSCAKELHREQAEGNAVTIEAYSADAQKTTLIDGGTSVYWEEGDQISVFFEEVNLEFSSINSKPTQNGTFVSDQSLIMGFTEDSEDLCLVGLYPYDEDAVIDGDVIVSSLPAVQQGRTGSFAKDANISIGKSNTTSIGFYNVTGGIRFSLVRGDVNKVIFSSNGGEKLAGAFQATVSGSRPAITGACAEGSTDTITLYPPEGETFKSGQWYYITAIPGTLAGGYTIELYTVDKKATLVSSASVTLKANVFGSLENVDKDAVYASIGHKEDWKAVSASGNWENLIDSDCSTSWKAETTGTQVIVLDMGASWPVDRILLAQSYDNKSGGTAPKKLKVEAGTDNSSWTTVLPEKDLIMNCYTQGYWFNSEHTSTVARYIRLTFSDPVNPANPIQFAEIDLGGPEYISGNCAGDAQIPSLVNTCAPWSWDHSRNIMWNRFFPLTDWIQVNTNNISCDAPDNMGNGTFVLFAFPQTGYETVAPNVTNGKIFQTLTLLPGDYRFRVSLPSTDTSAQYQKDYAVVSRGNTLTDYDNLLVNPSAKDPNYLSSINISQNKVVNVEKDVLFHLDEETTVSMGFVYQTNAPMNAYTQFYVNWVSFSAYLN